MLSNRAEQNIPANSYTAAYTAALPLAKLMVYGAQSGTAARNIREVMRRHQSTGGVPATCRTCGEPWYADIDGDDNPVEGCSAWLLADAIEAVLWVASNRPAS